MKRVLVLSDARLGHVNQSIAYAKYLGYEHDVVEVVFKSKVSKIFSYIFDALKIRTGILFQTKVHRRYDIVVGTGSSTYYAVKVLAKKMHAKSVTMMLPRGYRYDFDVIFAQNHDNPVKKDNIIEIPSNFAYVEPKGLYKAKKKSIAIVLGGDSKVFSMQEKEIAAYLDFIMKYYKGYEMVLSTSPRTSKKIEVLLEMYNFAYQVIFSQNPINPMADFLKECEMICITGDSTSMISEAISYGKSAVLVLPLESKGKNKFETFMQALEKKGYLHIFNGNIEQKNKKINFLTYIYKANEII